MVFIVCLVPQVVKAKISMFAVDSSSSELFFIEKFIFVPTNTNNYVNQIFLENLLGQAHFFL